MPSPSLRGVYIPLITPYEADGSVALGAIERLAHECLDAGAAGLVPLGTTGESPFLDTIEKRSIVEPPRASDESRDVHVIVGVGTNHTPGTVAAAEALGDVPGVTHALVVVPYYVRPSQAGIVEHMKAVAAASPVPLVLYNIPARTGRVLETAGMLELANTPNIVGVKQSVDGVDMPTLDLLASAPRDFAVLGGEDAYLLSVTYLGGAGAICASAHVCTEQFVALFECGVAGKVEEGHALHEALLPVVQAAFAEPNPSVFKAVLHTQGRIPTPDVRLPLVNASDAARDRALAAIAAAQG